MKLLVILILVLLLILFQGVFWNKFWARELTVDLHFADHGVTEGEDSSLIETITNRKWLPVPVLHVKFQMGRELVFSNSKNFKITDQNYRSDIFSCMPWQKIRRSLQGLLPLLLQVLLIKLFSSFFISSSILLFPPAFLAGRLYRKSRAHFSHAQFPDCFQSALALVTILYDSLYHCQMSVQKIQHFSY